MRQLPRHARTRIARAAIDTLEGRQLMAVHPLSALPQLDSRPDAAATLYIDFDGYKFDGVARNVAGQEVKPGTTPAFDADGDPTTYTNDELKMIREMWADVADVYSPFNLNVSTRPSPSVLQDKRDFVMIVGGDGSWYSNGNHSGAAPTGGFANSAPNVGFVFPARASEFGWVTRSRPISAVIAHEAGHGFGLKHHSLWSANGTLIDEYDPGDYKATPVMGHRNEPARMIWTNGPTKAGPNVLQDDLAILAGAANGFGLVPDESTSQLSTSPALGYSIAPELKGLYAVQGAITSGSDIDTYKFTNINAETISVFVGTGRTQMLTPGLRLSTAAGQTLAVGEYESFFNETQADVTNVPTGSLRVTVNSSGTYDNVGGYTLRVVAANVAGPQTVTQGGKVYLATNDFGPANGHNRYDWDLDGDGVFGEEGPDAARGDELGRLVQFDAANAPAGVATVHARVRISRDGWHRTMESVAKTTVTVQPRQVSVTATDAAAGEGQAKGAGGVVLGNGRFRISRTGPTTDTLTVKYKITGTAANGVDYGAIGGGTAYIAAGWSFGDIPITVKDDSAVEGIEHVKIEILDAGNYDPGASASAVVVIKDNDLAAPTDLSAKAVTPNRVDLAWADKSNNESRFVARVSTKADFSTYTDYSTAAANAAKLTLGYLSAGTTYYVKVRAANDDGVSAWTVAKTVSTPATMPAVRVNAGGPAFDADASPAFAADAHFAGGAASSFAGEVAGTVNDALYRTVRTGASFNYSIPASDGQYELKLHFVDPTSTAAGQRLFNVIADGVKVASNVDVFALAGGQKVRTIRTYAVNVYGGALDLSFVATKGQAIVSAIELIPKA